MSIHLDGVEILALGRQFKLGTLYNFVDDIIIPSKNMQHFMYLNN